MLFTFRNNHNDSQPRSQGAQRKTQQSPPANDKPTKSPSPTATEAAPKSDKPVQDLRQKLNRKSSANSPPQTPAPPSPNKAAPASPETAAAQPPKTVASPSPQASKPTPVATPPPTAAKFTGLNSVLTATAPPFRPLSSTTVLPQSQPPQPIVRDVPPPTFDPPPVRATSRLQQRLQIAVKPEAITVPTAAVRTVETSPPISNPIPSYPSVPRSKLSDRLVQRPLDGTVRKVTPPAPPLIAVPTYLSQSPAVLSENWSPPRKDSTQDPIGALANYSKSLGYGIPEYKILRMPKTNRIQCRVMVRVTISFINVATCYLINLLLDRSTTYRTRRIRTILSRCARRNCSPPPKHWRRCGSWHRRNDIRCAWTWTQSWC